MFCVEEVRGIVFLGMCVSVCPSLASIGLVQTAWCKRVTDGFYACGCVCLIDTDSPLSFAYALLEMCDVKQQISMIYRRINICYLLLKKRKNGSRPTYNEDNEM